LARGTIASTFGDVKKFLLALDRALYVPLVSFCAAYLLLHVVERTPWFKNHLYQVLVQGQPHEQLRAATTLARVGAEEQLLRALKDGNDSAHETARRALDHLWFNAAGSDAFELLDSAYQAAEKQQNTEALAILDRVIMKYPTYTEAWNRRASVFWQLGRYKESMADCERALKLNPNHYGAWQGLGVCQLKLGEVAEACRALRAALAIAPHDATTRQSLEKCEELLRLYPRTGRKGPLGDLI
jgi:tetratricopeptide (TPR) repeat protein